MRSKKTLKIFCAAVSLCLIITGFQIPALAAAVTITQNGNVVTAANGNYTLSYDLSTGRGYLSYGSTAVIQNFYSDFALNGQSTRISSYDAGTRTANWTSIGNNGYGTGGYRLAITCALSSGYTIKTYFDFYADNRFFIVSMEVTNASSMTINFMEPLAADNLDIGNFSDERIMSTPYTNNDDFGVCPVNAFGSFTGNSSWVCSVFDNTNKTGFVAGAATTTNWKSCQYLRTAASANGPLKGFSVFNTGGTQSGTTVATDKFFLGYYSDYRTGLEEFGAKYAAGEAPMTWSGEVPVGYNNWYTLRFKDPINTMYNVVDYLNNNLKSLGYNYVNLDATSLTDSEKQSFAGYCHSKGLKAGGYTCPFIVWSSDLDKQIPDSAYYFRDAILKDSSGNRMTWYLGADAYCLDATSPAGQAAVASFIKAFIDGGFDYLKMDFLDYGMQEGAHYDSTKNGMQAYREGMQIVKNLVQAADRPIFLSESIAPLLPNGYAHARRSGCDTEIGVGNYSGYERQAFNAAASWFTNGTIWKYNDPDMVMVDNYVGSEYWLNSYSSNQARLLSCYLAMGGGLWLASENLPLVPLDKMNQILKNPSVLSIAKLGKAARPVRMTNFLWGNEHCPPVTYLTGNNGDKIVTVANWDRSNPASIDVNWSDIGLSANGTYYVVDLFRNERLGSFTGKYTATFKGAAHDSMLLRITSANPSEPSPAVNLAQGKTFSASSFYSAGYEAGKSGDGSWSSRWSAAQTNGQWLEVDLGQNTNVNRVVLKEYKASEEFGNSYTVNDFSVQYWDGTSYVNVAKDSKIGFEKIVDFPAVNTGKLRISFTGASFLPSIREFEVYNIFGNTANTIALDNSDSSFSTYSDIRTVIQRMQVFQAQGTTLPRIDFFGYKTGTPNTLNVAIYSLDTNDNPVNKLFESNILQDNFPASLTRIPIYCNLTGLTAGANYGIVISSPLSPDTGNCYGFGYNDSNSMNNSFERLSTNGGSTWSTESNGNRDLKITIYK